MNANDHPLNWLPKSGAHVKIPGGAIWCQEWTVTTHADGTVEGTIILKLYTSKAAYEEAMKQQQELPPQVSPLTIGPPK